MEADLRNLIALIKRQSPTFYPKICNDDVFDYIEHRECQLALELMVYNGEPVVDQLSGDVLEEIVRMIQAYNLYEFSNDPQISEQYDKFVDAAKSKRR